MNFLSHKTVPVFLAAILMAAASLAPAIASADCDESQNEGGDKEKKNYRTIVGPDGKKTFVIEKAFVVCGKVPKPTVIYVLQASSINYEWENLKQDFLPKILKSVKDQPF